MLKERNELEKQVKNRIKKEVTNRNELNKKANLLRDEFGIDNNTALDIVVMNKAIETCSDSLLYKVAIIYKLNNLDKYFTQKEIREYGKKEVKNSFSFPLTIKAIKVDDDQYIGTVTSKFLMQLRDAQLINYNENVQRKMKKVEKGENTYYQINLNKKAVDEIKKSYKSKSYIPNIVTLNIPDDGEFYYDGDSLVINKIDHFDILDGYHRYISLSELSQLDSEFDYSMELRVVSFSDEKARQFIWQEDQKTKMKKIDSESFNMNADSNIVVRMLNESPLLRGLFNEGGIIDSALAGRMLQNTFFRENRKYAKGEQLSIKSYILGCFETLLEEDGEALDRMWDEDRIISFFYSIWKMKDKKEQIVDVYSFVYELSKTVEYKYLFVNKSFKRTDLNKLDKFMEEYLYV